MHTTSKSTTHDNNNFKSTHRINSPLLLNNRKQHQQQQKHNEIQSNGFYIKNNPILVASFLNVKYNYDLLQEGSSPEGKKLNNFKEYNTHEKNIIQEMNVLYRKTRNLYMPTKQKDLHKKDKNGIILQPLNPGLNKWLERKGNINFAQILPQKDISLDNTWLGPTPTNNTTTATTTNNTNDPTSLAKTRERASSISYMTSISPLIRNKSNVSSSAIHSSKLPAVRIKSFNDLNVEDLSPEKGLSPDIGTGRRGGIGGRGGIGAGAGGYGFDSMIPLRIVEPDSFCFCYDAGEKRFNNQFLARNRKIHHKIVRPSTEKIGSRNSSKDLDLSINCKSLRNTHYQKKEIRCESALKNRNV